MTEGASAVNIAIVVETENLAAADPEGLIDALGSIRSQRVALPRDVCTRTVLIDTGDTPPQLLDRISADDPDLEVVSLHDVNGYYQVKAATAELVEAEIVVFADADCRYEPGWLAGLLDGFSDPLVAIVTGETAMAVRNANGLAVAATFMLEPRSGNTGISDTYSYYFNNVAIRRTLLLDEPLLDHLAPSFRGTCSLHGRAVARSGMRVIRVHAAGAVHAAPAGPREFFWRYLMLGSDALVLAQELHLRGFSEFPTLRSVLVGQLRMIGGRVRILRRTKQAPPARLIAAVPLMILLTVLRLVGTVVESVRPGLLIQRSRTVLGE
jgi:hypothetical protein